MPKQGTRAEVNTFVKGLITEASPLNFPANASFDEENFELNRDGTRQRRLGFEYENGAVLRATPTMDMLTLYKNATNQFVWNGVNGDSTKDVLVIQTGNTISLHDANIMPVSSVLLSTNETIFDPTVRFSFAVVNGKLVVAGAYGAVLLVTFNGTAFEYSYKNIKVRDEWGMAETPDIEADNSKRLNTITQAHRYNLYNQSWGIPRRNGTGSNTNPVDTFFTELGQYPSNNEAVWTGLAYQPVTTNTSQTSAVALAAVDAFGLPITTTTSTSTNGFNDPYERMFTNLYQERLGADVKAAQGYFIIDLLSRGVSRSAAISDNKAKYPLMVADPSAYKVDATIGGASCVAEFAGHVFYAGFDGGLVDGDERSPVLNNYVVFSQLVRNDLDIVKCYQEGDPSSRSNSDIVDTDGGFIKISGAKRIIAMRQLNGKLIILADNGVWALSGGSDFGFSATNYKIEKRSSYGCISENSVVVNGSSLMYWGSDAIYTVTQNQYGELQVVDITAGTIQTYYNSIQEFEKQSVTGVYDLFQKKVKWIYRTGGALNSEAHSYELIFDTVLNAFYKYRIYSDFEYSNDLFGVFFSQTLIDPIYLVLHKNGLNLSYTFGKYQNRVFKDWGLTDAKAFMVTGALTASDSTIAKQAPYLVVHMNRTETGNPIDIQNLSSCMMRSQWDWSVSSKSNKFGPLVEVYKYRKPILTTEDYDTGVLVSSSRNKLRGRGKALALYFETSPRKDCQILGWSLTLNGNAIT